MKTRKQNVVILAAGQEVKVLNGHEDEEEIKEQVGYQELESYQKKTNVPFLRRRNNGKNECPKHQEVPIPVPHMALTFREQIRIVDGDSDCTELSTAEALDEPLVDVKMGNQ